MHLLIYCTVFVWLIYKCSGLTCRSGQSPKDDELRKVFNNCLQQLQLQSKNNENSRHLQEHTWKNKNEDERSNKGQTNMHDKQKNKGNRGNHNERGDSTQNTMNGNGRTDGRYERNDEKEDKGGSMNRMDTGDRMRYINENNRERNDMRTYGRSDHLTGQVDFLQSEEYGEASRINYYTSQSPRRYKREKRVEMNSGQRSQYNPHSQKASDYENGYKKEREHMSDNSSKEMDKACVLHCLLENLHMTDDSGMPDRYLVTHALTKDEKNEDLRDFLQETIEECFQILDNENTADKCEFSKNLLTCLTEKGRANCDDWNGKSVFLL